MDTILENKANTPLSEYGEFGLIEHLTQDIELQNASSVLGVGDDAAIIDAKNRHQVISTDLLVEGVHFDMHYTPLKHLGYKAIAGNLSDIAAMNALPEQVLAGIALSSRYTVEAVEELYQGMRLCCNRYGVDLVGGDTTSSVSGLFISITVLGYADKEKITRRNGANEHDLICVSGDLGGAYMGLLLLEREKEVYLQDPDNQPDLAGNDYILERQLKPEPRLDIVKQLAEKGILPTAMIDISDGLASEILHICKASQKGCCLYEDKIPIDVNTYDLAMEFGIVPSVAALNGGEDYELLFTIKQADYEKIKQIKDVSVIGHITDKNSDCQLITKDEKAVELKAQGWNSFRK
ncbi:MAG: thiamine-phosphate kinase [Lentimicrobiaceae bacterium]|nr:thiamine-phosphate kinase [Lentimicrobiaceae bacterium]